MSKRFVGAVTLAEGYCGTSVAGRAWPLRSAEISPILSLLAAGLQYQARQVEQVQNPDP